MFEAAQDAGRLGPIRDALRDFAAAVAETPELRSVLRNPQLEPSAKASILSDIVGEPALPCLGGACDKHPQHVRAVGQHV